MFIFEEAPSNRQVEVIARLTYILKKMNTSTSMNVLLFIVVVVLIMVHLFYYVTHFSLALID